MSDPMYDVQGTYKMLSIYNISLNDYYTSSFDIVVFQLYLKVIIKQSPTRII
jgi:hypothetical protein